MPDLIPMPEKHIYRAYGVWLLKSEHRLIRRLRRVYQPSVHGNKTWHTSFILMDYLQFNPPDYGSRVMDLGCGWGPAAIYCAKTFETETTAVDMDGAVFPYLKVLAALNNVQIDPVKKRFDQLTQKRLSQEKMIIGADICFWDDLVVSLRRLINRALRNGVDRIVIADPGRPTFYELVDDCAKRWDAELCAWYALEPQKRTGEILEVRPRK